MIYIEELNKLPVHRRQIIKKLENTKFKLVKANWSARFNNVCLQESVLLNYVIINYDMRPVILVFGKLRH